MVDDVYLFYKLKQLSHPVIISALLCAFVFYTGLIPVKSGNEFQSPLCKESIVNLSGVVSSSPMITPLRNYYTLTVDCTACESENACAQVKGNTLLYVPDYLINSFLPGRVYTSHKTSEIPFLIDTGIQLNCSVEYKKNKDAFFVTQVLDSFWGNSFKTYMYKLRALLRLRIRQVLYSWGESGFLFLALFTGIKEYVNHDLYLAFITGGLSYILALSGMHLSFINVFFEKITGIFICKRLACFFSIVPCFVFVWFAGPSSSLVRALVFVLILYMNSMLQLKSVDGINLLALSFLIHLMFFPAQIKEMGFIFSYTSLAGIFLFTPFFYSKIAKVIPPFAAKLFSTSVGAQVFTQPISYILFGTVTPFSAVLSLIILPLIVLFFFTGICSLIICFTMPFLSSVFSAIMTLIYSFIHFLL